MRLLYTSVDLFMRLQKEMKLPSFYGILSSKYRNAIKILLDCIILYFDGGLIIYYVYPFLNHEAYTFQWQSQVPRHLHIGFRWELPKKYLVIVSPSSL